MARGNRYETATIRRRGPLAALGTAVLSAGTLADGAYHGSQLLGMAPPTPGWGQVGQGGHLAIFCGMVLLVAHMALRGLREGTPRRPATARGARAPAEPAAVTAFCGPVSRR